MRRQRIVLSIIDVRVIQASILPEGIVCSILFGGELDAKVICKFNA